LVFEKRIEQEIIVWNGDFDLGGDEFALKQGIAIDGQGQRGKNCQGTSKTGEEGEKTADRVGKEKAEAKKIENGDFGKNKPENFLKKRDFDQQIKDEIEGENPIGEKNKRDEEKRQKGDNQFAFAKNGKKAADYRQVENKVANKEDVVVSKMLAPVGKEPDKAFGLVVVNFPIKVKTFNQGRVDQVAGFAIFEEKFLGVKAIVLILAGDLGGGEGVIEIGEKPKGVEGDG